MKHTFIALTLAAVFASPVMAKSPDWTFVEGNYIKVDFDDIADIKPDGFAVNGSYLVDENIFVTASVGRVSDGFQNIDLTAKVASVGVGYRLGVNTYTDAYGEASARYNKLRASGAGFRDRDSDTDLGVKIGLRSRVLDTVELDGSVGYNSTDFMDDTSFTGKATYYFTPSIAAGVSISAGSDEKIYGGNVRWVF